MNMNVNEISEETELNELDYDILVTRTVTYPCGHVHTYEKISACQKHWMEHHTLCPECMDRFFAVVSAPYAFWDAHAPLTRDRFREFVSRRGTEYGPDFLDKFYAELERNPVQL